jgi:archaellum biogenesis ATPase FlaH
LNIEEKLNLAIIAERDLRTVLDAKVTKDFFFTEEHRSVFVWIVDHWRTHGKVPGRSALEQNFPTYSTKKGPEPLKYYLDEVRAKKKFSLVWDVVSKAEFSLSEGDTEEALRLLSAGVVAAHAQVSELRDVDFTESWEERLDTYEQWKKYGDRLRGISSGFPTIDRATRGFQEEQLITVIGEPKSGKSTMLVRMLMSAHQSQKVPLFVGFEMSNQEQMARLDSMVAEISFTRLLSGRLNPKEESKLTRAMRRNRSAHPLIFSADPNGSTVSGVASKIEQYQPDIVFIDGVYMMDDELGGDKGSPQALTNITRSLKRLAQNRRIPVVCSTQVLTWKVNRSRGLRADAIGYSSSFIQDSDTIIGVEHVDDEDETLRKVSLLESRNSRKADTLVSWDWEVGSFTELNYEDALGLESPREVELIDPDESRKRSRRVVRGEPKV